MTGTTTPRLTRAAAPAFWRWPGRRPWLVFGLTFLLYAAGSLIALTLLRESGLSGVFFIPAGVTVAFLLRMEKRFWWLVILGAVAAEVAMDLAWGFPPGEVAFYAVGNAIEPLIGATIITGNVRSIDLRRVPDLGWFMVGALLAGPSIGAAVGALGPTLLAGEDFALVYPQWWLGNATGVVVVGGLILTLNTSPTRLSLASLPGAALLLGSIALTTVVVSQSNLEYMFTVLIGVIVAGAVFGSRAVAITAVAISATVGVHMVLGPNTLVSAMRPDEALMLMKMKVATFTLAGFLVAAQQAATVLAVRRGSQDQITASGLQAGMLPILDFEYQGVEVAARHAAATDHMFAGGDWYDVYTLPDGRVGLTVGDVVGHGLDATASMGRLRTAVAALAPHSRDPGELLSHLHTVVNGPDGTPYATAQCATIDPKTGTLDHASAGHPPMLLAAPGLEPQWVSGGRSAPLSGPSEGLRIHGTLQLPRQATIVLYSDGLVETRGDSIQVGLNLLKDVVAAVSPDRSAAETCDAIFKGMDVAASPQDDVVVMVVKWQARIAVPR